MKFMLKKMALAGLCMAASGLALADAPASAFSPDQQAQIGKIAADYLLAHPEILVQVSQKLQMQQAQEQSLAQRTAAIKYHDDLLNSKGTPEIGPADAKVAVIEFFDYQCVYCGHLAPQLEQVIKANPGVKFVFKEWPIFASRWENSALAAERGLEIYRQQGAKGYIAFHNAIYHTGHVEGALTQGDIDQASKVAGFSAKQAENPASKGAGALLEANDALAQNIGLTGTPGLIIMPINNPSLDNTTVYAGAAQADAIQAAIDKAAK